MKFDLEKLKQIPVIEVALKLGIDIKNNKSMCFFNHDEKTPSLSFNVEKNYWHCFGCGKSGDTIKLVQDYYKIDFKSACEWLARSFYINIANYQYRRKISRLKAKSRSNLISVNKWFKPDIEVYKWLIDSSILSMKSIDYLVKMRKFSMETIEYFSIRDIENPQKKFSEAKEKWGEERLLRCGLAAKSRSGSTNFIWWDHIILFPFYDKKNRITYIQGRQLYNKEPKYINLKGVKTQIYNLRIIENIKNNDFIYICEGTIDTLSAFQIGLNAVGIIGAAGFKEEWINYFLNYRVRIIPDSDEAGDKFAAKIKKAFNEIGKSVEVIKLPEGKDFTEFLRDIHS